MSSGVTSIFGSMGKLLLCRKKRWAKWARFLLIDQKFLAQQSTDNVEKTQKN